MAIYQSALTGPQMDEALLAVNRHDAEAWSAGTRGGAPVQSGDQTYNNNARYYAEQAAAHGGGMGIGQNLLDNWYFGNPVNQRGQTSYTSGYGLDRWKGSSQYLTITLKDGSVNFSATAGGGLFQFLDSKTYSAIAGKTVTLSALVTGTVSRTASDSIRIYDNIGGTLKKSIPFNGNGLYQGSFVMPEGMTHPAVAILSANGGDYDVVAVKLELGSQQTLAHQENGVWVLNEIPNYALELAKCQRYLFVTSGEKTYATVGFGIMRTTTKIDSVTQVPVPMRAVPALTASGTFCAEYDAALVDVTNITIDANGCSPTMLRWNCYLSGGAAEVGKPAIIMKKGSSAANLIFSAEL